MGSGGGELAGGDNAEFNVTNGAGGGPHLGGTGVYRINYTTPFAATAIPTVTAVMALNYFSPTITVVNSMYFTVKFTQLPTTGLPDDAGFMFEVVGRRPALP